MNNYNHDGVMGDRSTEKKTGDVTLTHKNNQTKNSINHEKITDVYYIGVVSSFFRSKTKPITHTQPV